MFAGINYLKNQVEKNKISSLQLLLNYLRPNPVFINTERYPVMNGPKELHWMNADNIDKEEK